MLGKSATELLQRLGLKEVKEWQELAYIVLSFPVVWICVPNRQGLFGFLFFNDHYWLLFFISLERPINAGISGTPV